MWWSALRWPMTGSTAERRRNCRWICSVMHSPFHADRAIEAAGRGGALVAKTSCRPQRSPSFVAGPGIDEIKTKSLEVADIVGRKLKSMRDCDAGSLQIGQLSGNLMDSQSRSAPCGRFVPLLRPRRYRTNRCAAQIVELRAPQLFRARRDACRAPAWRLQH